MKAQFQLIHLIIGIEINFCQNKEYFVKLTNFLSIFLLGGSAKLAEGPAEPVRPKMAEDSAESARFGRTLTDINLGC